MMLPRPSLSAALARELSSPLGCRPKLGRSTAPEANALGLGTYPLQRPAHRRLSYRVRLIALPLRGYRHSALPHVEVEAASPAIKGSGFRGKAQLTAAFGTDPENPANPRTEPCATSNTGSGG